MDIVVKYNFRGNGPEYRVASNPYCAPFLLGQYFGNNHEYNVHNVRKIHNVHYKM